MKTNTQHHATYQVGWINLFDRGDEYLTDKVYRTRDEALEAARGWTTYFDTVEIHFRVNPKDKE